MIGLSSASRRDTVLAAASCATSLALFFAGLGIFTVDPDARLLPKTENNSCAAVRIGSAVASIGVIIAFIINIHIYNSDNYRYLVYLLVPWSLGFGLTMESLSRRGFFPAALVLAASLAILLAVDEVRWLEGFQWIGPNRAVASRPTPETRLLDWLNRHPNVDYIVSDYWLIYRLAFLTGGRIKGRPYAEPNRFPEWGDGGDRAGRRVLILIPTAPACRRRRHRSRFGRLAAGGRLVGRIDGLEIYSWPSKSKSLK